MLYEYDGKFYIKPLINKVAEVKVSKKENNYEVDLIDKNKLIYITKQMEDKMSELTPEEAYKKSNKKGLGL